MQPPRIPMARDNTAIQAIERLAREGKTGAEIAAITGKDHGYVEYRMGLWRLESRSADPPTGVDPFKDRAFVAKVWAEARRLGLVAA